MARLRAEEALAGYHVRSKIEWNLRWVNDALDRTWKDEFLILLWCLLTVCLFVPPLRGFVLDGFAAMKIIHPDAPVIFLFGWAIIFAASFGMKSALSFFFPNRAANLVQAMGGVPDDVPMRAAKAANEVATSDYQSQFPPTMNGDRNS